jgi:putative Mg2+ transporter-C (MgtC) family protein
MHGSIHGMLATDLAAGFGQPTGQGWEQFGELAAALVLCSLIGLEREFRQKSAGLRTHTLVGLGAALFVLVSKYGFTDVLLEGRIMLDPSRVAAQIVSGVGFIGGGLIFVRRDVVRGLTTAAVVWVTAAVGSACGAGLPLLAAFVTAAHFVIVYGYPPLLRLLTRTRPATAVVQVTYREGEGVLRDVLALATGSGYAVERAGAERRATDEYEDDHRRGAPGGPPHVIDLRMRVVGPRALDDLLSTLSEQPGVLSVDSGELDDSNA